MCSYHLPSQSLTCSVTPLRFKHIIIRAPCNRRCSASLLKPLKYFTRPFCSLYTVTIWLGVISSHNRSEWEESDHINNYVINILLTSVRDFVTPMMEISLKRKLLVCEVSPEFVKGFRKSHYIAIMIFCLFKNGPYVDYFFIATTEDVKGCFSFFKGYKQYKSTVAIDQVNQLGKKQSTAKIRRKSNLSFSYIGKN